MEVILVVAIIAVGRQVIQVDFEHTPGTVLFGLSAVPRVPWRPSISARGAPRQGYWRVNWGQNYLSELGDETGGEAYWQGSASPVSLVPYLKDLADRLQNQYLLSVTVEEANGNLEPVRVTGKRGVSLMAASKIRM